jgi:hypothetical protein
MKLMGHSSVTVSQRYVHPSPESVERAFERMQTLNSVEAAKIGASTVSTTATKGEKAKAKQVN